MTTTVRSPTESGCRTVLRIDPHVHSTGSYDSREPVRRLLRAAVESGPDGLVVTDHDVIKESRRAVELAPEYGLLALPGVEVSTRHGHLLAIGVETVPAPDLPFARTVRRVRNAGGIAVVPHPFQRSRHGVPRRAILECDGVETLNACSVLDIRNGQAQRFARGQGYPSFGGSDAHVASEVGRAYTAVQLDCQVDDPSRLDPSVALDAMRRGATDAAGTRSRRRRSLRKYARNIRVRSRALAGISEGVIGAATARLGGE